MKVSYPKTVYRREGSVFLLRIQRDGETKVAVMAAREGSLLHAAGRVFGDPALGPFLPVLFDLHEARVTAPPRWLRLECERVAAGSARSSFWVWARHVFLTPKGPSKPRDALPLPASMERCPRCSGSGCEECFLGLRWKGGADPGDRFYLRWHHEWRSSRSMALSSSSLDVSEDWLEPLPEDDGADAGCFLLTNKLDLRPMQRGLSSLREEEAGAVFCVLSEATPIKPLSPLYRAVEKAQSAAMKSWRNAFLRASREETRRVQRILRAGEIFEAEYAKFLERVSF